MVAMARRIVASEVMVRCVISNAPTGRERLSRAMTALDSLPASNARPARAANRPSPSKMATLSPNSDANGFGHSLDIAGTGQSLT